MLPAAKPRGRLRQRSFRRKSPQFRLLAESKIAGLNSGHPTNVFNPHLDPLIEVFAGLRCEGDVTNHETHTNPHLRSQYADFVRRMALSFLTVAVI